MRIASLPNDIKNDTRKAPKVKSTDEENNDNINMNEYISIKSKTIMNLDNDKLKNSNKWRRPIKLMRPELIK